MSSLCHRFRKILLGCLAALCMAPLLARTPFGDLRFDRITSTSGLNVAFSTVIAQDSQGYMWFGTQHGLLRYDGFHTGAYRNCGPGPQSFGSDFIYSLYNDRQDRLWVGTGRGLCLYDPQHDRFIRYLDNLPPFGDLHNAPIMRISGDGDGNLWLASDFGLIHFYPESGNYTIVKFPAELDKIFDRKEGVALERDAQGNVWFGCNGGLYLLRQGTANLIPVSSDHDTARQNEVIALRVDRKQTLWIGTRSGLETLQTDAPVPTRVRVDSWQDVRNAWITEIIQDNQGDIWIATHNDGVYRWDRQTAQFKAYRHDPLELRSIVGDEVVALFQDRSGTLWIGTPIDGISKVELNSGDFKHISQDTRVGKGLVDNKIRAILNGPDNSIWLGTLGGGIDSYNPKSGAIRQVGDKPALIEDNGTYNTVAYKPFAADGRDKLWVVTETGIRHFNLIKEHFDESLPAGGAPDPAKVMSINLDKDGTLWALTADGLYRINRNHGAWQLYQPKPVAPGNAKPESFKAMLEDQFGRFWISTTNNLELFDKTSGQFSHFADRPHAKGTSNGALLVALFVDSRGNLWFDNENGLTELEIANNRVVAQHMFLTATMVDSILEDRRGVIWVSTDDGILRYDAQAAGFRHFNSLEDDTVSGYFIGAALLADDGAIYFGGPHGLTGFRPEALNEANHPPPPVQITDFQIFNKSVDIDAGGEHGILTTTIQTTKAVTLSYRDSVFSIEFAALDFANPLANQYAYQLQGFDPDWRHTDATRRLATYTNLNPGHYVFHVKAANSDGVWNETGAQLEITITPPFWKTWWFTLLAVVLLVSAMLAAYRHRIRGFLRQNEALERLVEQRTQEVVRQKNVIEEKNRQLEAVNQLQEEHQSELTHFLAVASHDLRQPIHALNIYLGTLTEFDVRESARTVFDKMRKCVQNMDEMFLALLDLSLLEAHAVKPRIEHFSIATILSLIDVEFTPQANAAGLTLTVEHCNEWIDSDANLIKQILANLTANAVRYTKAGSIVLRCEKIGDRLRVSVQDTGIGISPSQQSIVFKKFHQLGNTDREKAKGIGLGLAIVKRLCELLELPMHLHSVPGQGSTFAIDLPLSVNRAHELAGGAAAQFASQVSLSNALVVVVDDDEMILDAMRGLLEKWGCAVTTAASGREAIAMFGTSARVPDVLICDYRLHVNEDGIDTIHMLRNEFNQEIPALLITGDASSDMIRNRESDSIQVMHKPLRSEVLRDALVRLLYPEATHLHEDGV